MDTGALYVTLLGGFFFVLGAAQWLRPELHRLSWFLSRADGPGTGETAQQHMNSIARAMAVAGMYVAGCFLSLGWMPVFERLYAALATVLTGG